jgi:hypothetical protein
MQLGYMAVLKGCIAVHQAARHHTLPIPALATVP